MDIGNKKIWQVAAGDTDRDYVEVCLEWDVILNGPGSEGPWPDCSEPLRTGWGLSSRKISDLRRFCEEIQDGDLVVLRLGTSDVFGVGVVVGGYLWNEAFGDVDGWELQHVRRVRWLWKYGETPMRFPPYTMKLGDTVQVLDAQPVIEWIKGLTIDEAAWTRPLKELPAAPEEATWQEIAEYLFDRGIGDAAIEHLTGQIDELARIASWYQRSTGPSEAETIAYLVIPLLRALGWTPQKMAVEWHGVDIALFWTLPRTDENLTAIVEVKAKGRSCLNAQPEARVYAEQPGRQSCARLIVTDGLRYGVYLRKDGAFNNCPDAYLNLTQMRRDYPVLHCRGAKEAFLLMAADWVPGVVP